MLTITVNAADSNTVPIPQDELEKLGISAGDEIEFYKNETGEIVLRNAAESERKQKFEQAKKDVFEEWKDVFIALAKGAEDSEEVKSADNRKFILRRTKTGDYDFILTTINNLIVFESKTFKSKEDAQRAVDIMKNEISEIKDGILSLPDHTELAGE